MRDVSIPEKINKLKDERAYFDARRLPEPCYKYVAWVDLMGAASIMSSSLTIAANHIGKIHATALKANQDIPGDASVYPIVDGVYIVSSSQDTVLACVKYVLRNLA